MKIVDGCEVMWSRNGILPYNMNIIVNLETYGIKEMRVTKDEEFELTEVFSSFCYPPITIECTFYSAHLGFK